MMSWWLVAQVVLLMFVAALLVEGVTVAVIEKRREDAIKRKEAGL